MGLKREDMGRTDSGRTVSWWPKALYEYRKDFSEVYMSIGKLLTSLVFYEIQIYGEITTSLKSVINMVC